MSAAGLPDIDHIDATGLRVAIVTSTWNAEICERLRTSAIAKAEHCGASISEFRVVGALELPVVVQELAPRFDAVVALGCVVRGSTPHFDYVCDSVTQGLTRIALDTSTPIGNGVLTTLNQEQAIERTGEYEDKGADAMIAALHTACVLARIRKGLD
ncbi:6,7-dimethyl-8-ribityllumazine synthase [Corynebacterium freiburgense]|uniref:6,7-dimethyl-8-ribityllumazine synthase n=1 Tax=Corynebacterium freiburgense TaxID=556548 RepID=UPI0004005409|nr:6,7-dimethyl-8-ribityllumazine synthase [Corynebacterium freiburgense]WJZ02754.1 6,7-dimethyl-8-ribityllumazine synthase [Corynebacterium freiburgense]